MLGPARFTLFPHDCIPSHGSNTIGKFADDTPVAGLISDNNESHYPEEVQHLSQWCPRKTPPAPLSIRGQEVERGDSIKFPGIYIMADLSLALNISHLERRRLFFLKQAGLSSQLLVNLYRATAESIPCHCVVQDRKGLG